MVMYPSFISGELVVISSRQGAESTSASMILMLESEAGRFRMWKLDRCEL